MLFKSEVYVNMPHRCVWFLTGVDGLMVRIVAFQAIGSGSIPDRRIAVLLFALLSTQHIGKLRGKTTRAVVRLFEGDKLDGR
jgi:hypothetical protein